MIRAVLSLSILLSSATALAGKPEDYLGMWAITMVATYSSCDKAAKVGDTKVEEWNFNLESGKIKTVTVGGTGTDANGAAVAVDAADLPIIVWQELDPTRNGTYVRKSNR